MIDEMEKFSILLPVKSIVSLYFDIGNTVCTDIDLVGYSSNTKALKNSLELLIDLQFIKKVEGKYTKLFNNDKEKFQTELKEILLLQHGKFIQDIIMGKTQYDIETKEIFIMRNCIPLKITGLFMLLNDYGEIQLSGNKIIIVGKSMQNLIIQKDNRRQISQEELEKKLLRNKELGEQAEKFVMEYEKNKLTHLGINLEPKQISVIDVTAGFDILSFFSNNPNDEKYIEVKNCDERYNFHISENEIKIAKKYGKNYFLYLFNRFEKKVKEIKNPYSIFFEEDSDCWIVENDGYKIHKI